MTLEEKIEELNAPFAHKEILRHQIKLIGKPWVEDRIKAYKSVQEMREYLNSLSEEEAHKLMIEQVEKIKRLREERMSRGEDSFSRRRFKKI